MHFLYYRGNIAEALTVQLVRSMFTIISVLTMTWDRWGGLCRAKLGYLNKFWKKKNSQLFMEMSVNLVFLTGLIKVGSFHVSHKIQESKIKLNSEGFLKLFSLPLLRTSPVASSEELNNQIVKILKLYKVIDIDKNT